MSTELMIGSGLPQNKKEIELYNSNVKDLAISGEVDIIKLARTVNIMKRVVENFEKEPEIQDALLNEVSKYGKGELSEIQSKEVGTKYDFSNCNHPEYNSIILEIESLTERKKQLESYLKTINKETDFIDPLSGEMVKLLPCVKSSTTKCVFTIK
jgi:hypothetical protein